jgi:hypothetical protein
VRIAHHITPRRDARATDRSDLSKSGERDSGKTREKAQPIYLLAEVRGKFPAVNFLIFNYNVYKFIVQWEFGDRSDRRSAGK